MTEEERKRLIKWLGLCWHEASDDDYMLCRHCGITFQGDWRDDGGFKHFYAIIEQRTFTEPDDFFACFERLVEKNDLSLFYAWGGLIWAKTLTTYINHISGLMAWLLSKTDTGHYRFCVLLAEWLKEAQDE